MTAWEKSAVTGVAASVLMFATAAVAGVWLPDVWRDAGRDDTGKQLENACANVRDVCQKANVTCAAMAAQRSTEAAKTRVELDTCLQDLTLAQTCARGEP